MLFNSWQFLVFFPVVLIAYYILPQKARKYFLLIASLYFYMNWSASYVVLILFSIVATYLGGIFIERINENKKPQSEKIKAKKTVLISVLAVNLAILFVFKYFNFFFARLFQVIGLVGLELQVPYLNLLLPVGISFYTFQALSYTIDVYRGTIKAEHRFVNYALFVSFFPQLVAGPIERSKNLLPQIDDLSGFDFDNFKQGLKIMLYGFFQKVVIADNISAVVNTVFNDVQNYYGAQVLMASVLFAVQIYCDFSGYSLIAVGCAKCMNVKLMYNFKNPYFSRTIKEFWARWHISLSQWFKDYLYIPLGGNRKGALRTNINVFIVFAVSGLWHGAELTFLFWGFLHGFYQIVGSLTNNVRAKMRKALHINENKAFYNIYSRLITFLLAAFAFIFFRANSMGESVVILKNLLNLQYYSAQYFNLSNLGVDNTQAVVILLALLLLFVCSYLQYTGKYESLSKITPAPIRWAGYIAAVNLILIFGNYGPAGTASQFIYFQF